MKYILLFAVLILAAVGCKKKEDTLPVHDYSCRTYYGAYKTNDTNSIQGGTPFWYNVKEDTLKGVDTYFVKSYVVSIDHNIIKDSVVDLHTLPDTFAVYQRDTRCDRL